MTRRRWIADEFSADRAALVGAHAAHLARTLRARVGQEFEVACGDQVRHGTVSRVADDRVEFVLGEEVPAQTVVPITLLLAIFKFDRMEWAIEKCTELNVTRIVPLIARRTEKHLAAAAQKRAERWRRIAREASEQSRRVTPPEIAAPAKLKNALASYLPLSLLPTNRSEDSSPAEAGARADAIEPRRGETAFSPGRKPWVGSQKESSPVGTAQTVSDDLRLVLAETEREASLSDILTARERLASLALAVGPEGGWSEDELQLFANSHWLAASLGETILRAETAAIAAVAIARATL
jgi:16S rRNA (uracil1498-N3)-methyltransferase